MVLVGAVGGGRRWKEKKIELAGQCVDVGSQETATFLYLITFRK